MQVIEVVKWLDVAFLIAACLFMVIFVIKVRKGGD